MNEEIYKGKTCKELGWKEGDTFKMSKDMDMNVYGISVGDVVTLFLDDGTDLPTYINSYGDEYFLYDYEVEKIDNNCSLHSLLKDFHKGHDVAVVLTRDGYSLEFDNYSFTELTLEELTDKLGLLKKLFPNEEA